MKISGPVSVHVLKYGNKHIVLWGDKHGDKQHYCQCREHKHCMFVTTFIKNIKDNYDLFIESPWYSKEEKRSLIGKKFDDVNAIREMANTFYQEMYFHRRKNTINRVHFTDIRTEKTIRPMTNVINQLMAILFKNKDVSDVSFIKTLQQYRSVKQIKQFIDDIINDTNHKVWKQIHKLSQDKQRLVRRFHKDMCRHLLVSTQAYDKSHHELFHVQKDNYTNDLLVIFDNLLIWLSYLKDIYTISRMLYYLQKTTLIMSYDGDYHTRIYLYFFQSYLPETKTIWSFSSKKRCVNLPISIARNMFPTTAY